MNQNARRILPYLALALLAYMPIFGHLDGLPIRIWDESRLAINAYEAQRDGHWLVAHFEGRPDMWNTKPPLMVWAQALLMKALGVNELAVRLPSALAGFLTALLLLAFLRRGLGSPRLGLLAAFVLVSSAGYVGLHSTRTGDYDALLSLLTTLGGLLIFAYFETKDRRLLYLFFLSVALAVLTKSVAGLLFLPGVALYAALRAEVLPLLRNRHVYQGIGLFLALVGSFYLAREAFNPGYLEAVWNNELGGRYLEVIEGHDEGFWFYYENLVSGRFRAWHLLLPLGAAAGLLSKDGRASRLALFSVVLVGTFWLAISLAKTKLEWYDVPLYPFMAILVAFFLDLVFRFFDQADWARLNLRWNFLPYAFLFLVGLRPYQEVLAMNYLPKEKSEGDAAFYEISYFLRDAARGHQAIDGHVLSFEDYQAHNLFYVNLLNEKGAEVAFKHWHGLEPGDRAVAYQHGVKEYIRAHYHHELLRTHGAVEIYLIHAKLPE